MTYETLEDLATAYLRNWRDNSEDDFWAHGEVLRLSGEDPDICWDVLLELVRLADSKRTLCYIAAGPLERLLKEYGTRFIHASREQALNNPKFLYALCNVWLKKEDEAYTPMLSIFEERGLKTLEDAESLID